MKNGAGFRGGKAFGVFATMALVLFPASIFASCGSSKSPQPGTTSTTSSSVNNTLPPNTSAGALLRGSLAAAERSGSFTFDMYEASGKSGHTLSLLIKGDVTMSGGAMTFESSSRLIDDLFGCSRTTGSRDQRKNRYHNSRSYCHSPHVARMASVLKR